MLWIFHLRRIYPIWNGGKCWHTCHFDGKQVEWGFPSNFSLISCRHVIAVWLEFDGNRAILVFPSNFGFILMYKVASLGHLMRKIGKQAAQIFSEFDGNFVDGCFPSNSSLIPKKQAEHIFWGFDGNLDNDRFPSKFCLVSQKQAAHIWRNEVSSLMSYTEFDRIRHTLALLLNSQLTDLPALCLFLMGKHGIRRNSAF